MPHPEQPMRYHVGYEITTRQPAPAWTPRQIVDDGKKLYLLYPEVTLFTTVPLVRLDRRQRPTTGECAAVSQCGHSRSTRAGAGVACWGWRGGRSGDHHTRQRAPHDYLSR